MEFEIGDLVSSDDPGDIGIIIATSADYVKVRWIRLTKERGDFLNGLQKAVHSDTVGEVRSDYIEDYLPIEQVQ